MPEFLPSDQPIRAAMAAQESDASLVGSWLQPGKTAGGEDFSSAGNDGTATAVTWGYRGGEFDGADSVIAMAAELVGSGAVSLEFWFRADSLGENNVGRVVDNGNFVIWTSTANRINLVSDGATTATTGDNAYTTGAFTHGVVTRAADGTANFYINGQLTGSADQDSGTPAAGGAVLKIGNGPASIRTWDGALASVSLYSEVKTAGWVATRYAAAVPDTRVKLWVPFGDQDYSVYGNTLTASGGIILGRRMELDGTDDMLDAGDIGNITQVAMWVRPATTSEQLFRVDTGASVSLVTGTVTYTGLTASATYVNGVAGTTMVAGAWQRLVCQFTQDDANNHEIGYDGANYGQIEVCDWRSSDGNWSAAEVAIDYAQTELYY